MMAAAVSCATASADIEPQKSHAIFSSFTYEGNDDYYAANPLASDSSFYNPVLPGWYSDPSVCTNGEGDYYLVTSTFTYFPGVPIFHSRDLVNWEQKGHVLTRPSQLQNMEKQHVSGGIFAPDIAYNPANKTYYMITTNVGSGNFFVKTQDPTGEWSDPVMLPEVQGIDPAFFFDEDGKAYIVNNDDAPNGAPEYPGHRTVRVVEFDTATDRCIGERKIVVNKGVRPEEKPIWCEGPHIYKINGKYYLMTAEGGTSTWHSEVIYRGDSPMGPFTPWEGNPILTQRTLDKSRTNPVTCAGHADIVQGPDGDWWGVFLACRPIENDMENLGRETFLMPVKWTEDGWPYMTRQNEEVPLQLSKNGYRRSENATFGNFAHTDNFTDSVLSYKWHTLRGPATEYYSLTTNPGHLTIKCADVKSTDKAVLPYVGRRIQHHKYTAGTKLTFVPENDSECAGMLLFKDEVHQYFLGKDSKDSRQRMVLRRITENGTEEIAGKELDPANKSVNLMIESQGLNLNFKYSLDNGNTWEILASGLDAGFMSTARAGGFTGTTVGLYASGASN
ncbi:glycoside hydrolase family 43 protein [Muribaculum intestinale]|uniref:glycoside hydrolase family 43 protein n=1 Tax=Muribaculum intestinale TaxID=1796646 RepID=UPI002634C523|nr:glycoside hydrolase family 43 protein [Muribaculum intestinale]